MTLAYTRYPKFLAIEHVLHASPCAISNAHTPHAPDFTRHALLRSPRAWDDPCLSTSALSWRHPTYVNISRHLPMSAHVSSWVWPLTTIVDRWLLDQGQKFSTGPVLLSFSHRFRFWAPFLHLRSLNPTFWSFSSLWLNKMNEISYVLSPLCWMVLLASMHGLKIWLSSQGS